MHHTTCRHAQVYFNLQYNKYSLCIPPFLKFIGIGFPSDPVIWGLPFANKYNEETNVATLMADIFANALLFNHCRKWIWWKTYIFIKHWQKSIHLHNYRNQLRKYGKKTRRNWPIKLWYIWKISMSMSLPRAFNCKSCLIIVWLCWSVSSIKTLSILIACYQYPISPHQDDNGVLRLLAM